MSRRLQSATAVSVALTFFVVSAFRPDQIDIFVTVRVFLVASLLLATLGAIIAAARGLAPWTRAILPFLASLEVGLVASHWMPRIVGVVSLGIADVALLGFALWTIFQVRKSLGDSRPEQRIEQSLLRFFPFALSRVAAIELTIVASAFRVLPYIWFNQRPGAATYVETAKIKLLVFAMPVMLIPDLLFVHLFLPRAWLAGKITLDILDVYACFWVLGFFSTMASRPHELSGPILRFNQGMLSTAEMSAANIESVKVLGPQRGLGILGRRPDEARMVVGGVPAVEIRLRDPACVRGIFIRGCRSVNRLVVASDRPGDLAQMLTSSV